MGAVVACFAPRTRERARAPTAWRALALSLSAQDSIGDLAAKIREIKRKADASEAMVQEICRDIRALDVAKKNLTNTINVLARLKTLSSAVEDLRANSTRRDYEKAAPIFEAAIAMFAHFTEYRDMPKVSELATAVEKIRDELRCVRRGAARRGACWRPPAIPPHPPPCPPQPALQRGRDRGL